MNGEVNKFYFMGPNILIKVTGLGFSIRDIGAKSEEQQGIIEFTIIRNDRFAHFTNFR